MRFRDDTVRWHWILVTAKDYRINLQGKGPGFLSETMLMDIRFVCFPPVRIVTLLFRVLGNVPFELLFYFYFSTCFHIIKDIFLLIKYTYTACYFSYPVLLKNHKSQKSQRSFLNDILYSCLLCGKHKANNEMDLVIEIICDIQYDVTRNQRFSNLLLIQTSLEISLPNVQWSIDFFGKLFYQTIINIINFWEERYDPS